MHELQTLWTDSTVAGSPFLAGVLGNWVATAGQWVFDNTDNTLKKLLANDLRLLLQNHHLQRVVRIAQCKAMEAVCARCLQSKHWEVTGLFSSRSTRGNVWKGVADPEARSILWWMNQFRKEAERAEKLSPAELERAFALDSAQLPALLRAGAEIGSLENETALRHRATDDWIQALEDFRNRFVASKDVTRLELALLQVGLSPGRMLGLPAALENCVRSEWFDLLRVAFRELLKSDKYPEARHAFELDVLAKLEQGVDAGFEAMSAKLESTDAVWAARWRDAGEWMRAVSGVLDDMVRELEAVRRGQQALQRFVLAGFIDLKDHEAAYWGLQNADLDRALVGQERPEEIKALIRKTLFGREGWLARFDEFLSHPTECTYVLDGLTGSGKSRVSLAAARRAEEQQFAVLFVASAAANVAAVIEQWIDVWQEADQALLHASVGALPADRLVWAGQTGTLLARFPGSEAIALEQAKALVSASVGALPADRLASAEKIGALLDRFPASEAIALEQAKALLNATADASPADMLARAGDIGALLARFPTSEAIALAQAHVLYHALVDEARLAEKAACMQEIETLLMRFPASEAIAQVHALAQQELAEHRPPV